MRVKSTSPPNFCRQSDGEGIFESENGPPFVIRGTKDEISLRARSFHVISTVVCHILSPDTRLNVSDQRALVGREYR